MTSRDCSYSRPKEPERESSPHLSVSLGLPFKSSTFRMLPIYLLFASLAGVKAALTYKGVDWSSILVTERAGKTYKTASGTVQPFETILKSSGVNTVRQRLWVNPTNGDYNLDYNIKLARRAKAAGLDVYLNMHFSDTWADPGNQVCLLSSLLSAKEWC